MVKVITYGTFDLLHYGHIRLLERAKALGDYLIVGVTASDFDKTRGKINVQQSLMERIQGVRSTGLADEIIVEEYQGQKIDDIKRLQADIFAVGSDWKGKFDYLKEYCQVIYLPRTEGVSSTEIRDGKRMTRIGLVGESSILNKFYRECAYVNGAEVSGVFSRDVSELDKKFQTSQTDSYEKLLEASDALYILSKPKYHYDQIKLALENGKHILVEAPITPKVKETEELIALAREKGLVLMDAIKTAYSTAFHRLTLLLKGGAIGDIVSVDAACTSLRTVTSENIGTMWTSINKWGPTAMLSVFEILGTEYLSKHIAAHFVDEDKSFDNFSKISFIYPSAVASVKVANGVKSEGELIVSGTKGYIYVPAPWWITDYFEIRFEDQSLNRRCFYQLDGEGIRYEIAAFIRNIDNSAKHSKELYSYISESTSKAIVKMIEDFNLKKDLSELIY